MIFYISYGSLKSYLCTKQFTITLQNKKYVKSHGHYIMIINTKIMYSILYSY